MCVCVCVCVLSDENPRSHNHTHIRTHAQTRLPYSVLPLTAYHLPLNAGQQFKRFRLRCRQTSACRHSGKLFRTCRKKKGKKTHIKFSTQRGRKMDIRTIGSEKTERQRRGQTDREKETRRDTQKKGGQTGRQTDIIIICLFSPAKSFRAFFLFFLSFIF